MDSKTLHWIIDQFYKNYPKAYKMGRLTESYEFKKFSKKVRRIIPEWYQEILLKYPLVNFEIGIPNDHGDEEFIGKPMEELPLMGMTFLSIEEIAESALNFFPDYQLLKDRIIRIAEDKYATQEGIFINTLQDNPEVRLVFHDFGETGKEVFSESELLLESFTDFFKYGKLKDKYRE